jgi:phage shock protein C
LAGKRLERSSHGYIGGVCAGLASYWNLDPLVIRIIAVVGAFLSLGVIALAYLLLWAVLPLSSDGDSHPFDVEPEEVQSDTYGCVDCEQARGKGSDISARTAAAYAAMQASRQGRYVGISHTPPPAPASYAQACADGSIYYQSKAIDAKIYETIMAGTASEIEDEVESGEGENHPIKLFFAVVAGLAIVFFLAALIISSRIAGSEWWQFWPLAFCVAGLGIMIVPVWSGHFLSRVVTGIFVFAIGVMLLPMSVGIISWQTLTNMVLNMWPFLFASGFLLALGIGRQSKAAWVAAACCFVFFAIGGVWLFGLPGPMDNFIFLGHNHSFLVPGPWESSQFNFDSKTGKELVTSLSSDLLAYFDAL